MRQGPRRRTGYASRMARPVLAVIFGTFTLRLATGITGAMLIYYYAAFPQYGGEPVDPRTVGILGALFYADRARRLAAVRDPVRPRRAPADHAARPGVRRRRRDHHRVHRQPPGHRLHPPPRGRVDRRLGAVDPRLHRLRDRRRRDPARQGRRPLRGRDAGRPDGRLRPRRAAVPAVRPHGVPAQRPRLRRVVRDLPVRRAEGRGAGAGRPLARPRGGAAAVREDPARQPRLAPGADLDRHQRDARPVHEPDPVPARSRAEPATSPTSS